LTYILSRSRTGFRKTDTIINRLIRGAIQTGLFASIFALADLFSFVLHGDTNLYAMFAFPIGRIYTNVCPFNQYQSYDIDIINYRPFWIPSTLVLI
jgi:thioester reductase-like protein